MKQVHFIEMENIDGGDLIDIIDKTGPLTEQISRYFAT